MCTPVPPPSDDAETATADGEPVWHGPDPGHLRSYREFASEKPGEALFLKYVDPDEVEGERLEVHEENLARLRG